MFTGQLIPWWRRLAQGLALGSALLLLLCMAAGEASACPMCKAALANTEGGDRVIRGFFWSILFMLSMPFAIFSAMGTYFYLLVRQSRALAADPLANLETASAESPSSDSPRPLAPNAPTASRSETM